MVPGLKLGTRRFVQKLSGGSQNKQQLIFLVIIRNEEVLLRVNEQRNILHEIRKRKANWIGHILRRNCLLQQVIEGKMKGQIEVTRRRGRRRKKLLDDLKDRRGYCELKEEALDRTVWRNRFGRGFGPVVWQITDDDDSAPPSERLLIVRPLRTAAGSAGAMRTAAIACSWSINFYVNDAAFFYELFAISARQFHSDLYFPSSLWTSPYSKLFEVPDPFCPFPVTTSFPVSSEITSFSILLQTSWFWVYFFQNCVTVQLDRTLRKKQLAVLLNNQLAAAYVTVLLRKFCAVEQHECSS